LALRGSKISQIEKYKLDKGSLFAAYIQMKSARDIKTRRIYGTDLLLDEWVEVISKIGRILKSGDIRANPFPVSNVARKEAVCEGCPFLTICKRGLYSELTAAEKEDDERAPH
ncbi:MAG: hypothetical protein U9R24_00715, partial [Thermodesulfobacteriota bacterium]|nr:hypothetical protein [Thermodesulfobacteriota bacterium]